MIDNYDVKVKELVNSIFEDISKSKSISDLKNIRTQ